MSDLPRRISRALIFVCALALVGAGAISFALDHAHISAPLPTATSMPYIPPTNTPIATPTIGSIHVQGYTLPDLTYPNGARLKYDGEIKTDTGMYPPNSLVGAFVTRDDYSKAADYYLRILSAKGYMPLPKESNFGVECQPTTPCNVRFVNMIKGNVVIRITVYGAEFVIEKQGQAPALLVSQLKADQTLITYNTKLGVAPVPTPTVTTPAPATIANTTNRARVEAAFKTDLQRLGIAHPLVPTADLTGYVVNPDTHVSGVNYTIGTKGIALMMRLRGSSDPNAQQGSPIFRGVPAFYQNNPMEGHQSLQWNEPGYDQTNGNIITTSYVLRATNMSETEFWQIANSLSPAPKLSRTFGGVSLGVSAGADGRSRELPPSLGAPTLVTIWEGYGHPEYHYANGLILVGDPVWQITAEAPFTGSTVEGFTLGDSRETYNKLYGANVDTSLPRPENDQIYVKDELGTWLNIHFDKDGKATSINIGQLIEVVH